VRVGGADVAAPEDERTPSLPLTGYLRKIFGDVLAEVLKFSGGAGFAVDVCLLGTKVAPPTL
jgi:hypothetical protein